MTKFRKEKQETGHKAFDRNVVRETVLLNRMEFVPDETYTNRNQFIRRAKKYKMGQNIFRKYFNRTVNRIPRFYPPFRLTENTRETAK